jgi:hypothetical protein
MTKIKPVEVNYPSDEIESEWYAEWQKMPREQQFSLQEYSHYAIRKACDWTAAHAKQQQLRVEELEEALRSIRGWRELRDTNEFPVQRVEKIVDEALSAKARENKDV